MTDSAGTELALTESVTGLVAADRRMLEALVCPVTQETLGYDAERGELTSRRAGLAYPIRDGIPVMLVSEARALD